MSRRLFAAVVVPAALCVLGATTAARSQDHYAGREAWQRVPEIFKAMNVQEGSAVADLGAGGGFFTTRLSKAVGKTGRVYAVDINRSTIERLNQLVTAEALSNVTVVTGEAADPKLPTGQLDAILIVNAYHEMTEYKQLLLKLHAALKPGGRLAIVDNTPPTADGSTPQQPRRPYLAIELAARQVQDAGLRVVRRDETFTKHRDQSGTERIEWLLVGQKTPA
jgi:ubiquinone/menaquinone biosynthesis C-methylase UbiE